MTCRGDGVTMASGGSRIVGKSKLCASHGVAVVVITVAVLAVVFDAALSVTALSEDWLKDANRLSTNMVEGR